MSRDSLKEAAVVLGAKDGAIMAAKISLKIQEDVAADIVRGYENNDPEILDICPKPLEGFYKDEAAPMFILDGIADLADKLAVLKADDDEDVLSTYDNSYRETFWAILLTKAKAISDGRL